MMSLTRKFRDYAKGLRKEVNNMFDGMRTYANPYIAPTAPDISVYAAHCISRRRHLKRRMRQYGRIR